jgi:hypothetical protein
MKWKLLAVIGTVPLLGTSCSTMDLGGSVPIPFTNPPTNARLDLDVRPLPPRFCIGLDLVPREEPAAVSETAK